MIELPNGVHPNEATPALIDFGGVQRPNSGAGILRIDRPGNRYRASFMLPTKRIAEQGRVIISRLIRAKSEGLRVPYPLGGVNQGLPGSPVVHGAGQTGMAITVRGLTPRYNAKEGFWLSIAEPLSGGSVQHYLHNVAGGVIADASGAASIPLSEMLRAPFPDGAAIHLRKPMIEGLVAGDERSWNISVSLMTDIDFEIEEAA